MLILSTPNIEGHKIVEYYGFVTGESLLGFELKLKSF